MTSTNATTAAVWTGPTQIDLMQEVVRLAGLGVVAFGSNTRLPTPPWADAAEPADDLRHLAETTDASALLLAEPEDFADGRDDTELRAVLRAAQRGTTVLSLEPVPALALRLGDPAWREASDAARQRVTLTPLMRRGAMHRQLTDLLTGFGPIEAVSLSTCCRPGEGSLGARLYDACDLLHQLLGAADAVDAAHAPGPDSPRSLETLRCLEGHLSAVVRFELGPVASIFASDRAGSWHRSLTIVGPGGRIVADDRGLVWTDAAGSTAETLGTGLAGDDIAAAVLADDIAAALGRSPPIVPIDHGAVLGLAHAALLSISTGHAEDPRELARIAGG
ncbi:MAG: hypothetical protein ACTS22_06455 [Phycisphaerales bacterium]